MYAYVCVFFVQCVLVATRLSSIPQSVCIVYPFTDGCTIPHPVTDADCRDGAISCTLAITHSPPTCVLCITWALPVSGTSASPPVRDASVEVAGPESMCFMTTLTTTGPPLAEATSTCLRTQPVNDGTTNYYGIETANDDIVSINDCKWILHIHTILEYELPVLCR